MRKQPKQTSRSQRPLIESLEVRQLLSASVFQFTTSTGALTINGTGKNNHITVNANTKHLVASVNGLVKSYKTTAVQSLTVNGNGKNDVIKVGSSVTIPAVLKGGIGDNVIQGGAGTTDFVPAGGTDAVIGFHTGDAGEDGTNAPAPPPAKGGLVFGSVASVNATAGTITVNDVIDNGQVKRKSFNVSTSTTITIDGATGTLAQLGTLAAGSHVVLQISPSAATSATSIAAVGPHVQGSVVSVDTTADTITLQGENGAANQFYTVSPTAAITLDGAASTLSAITANTNVSVWLSASNGTTAITIDAGGPQGNGNGGGQGGSNEGEGAAIGSIASVDTNAGTVTLTVLSPTGTTTQMFTVNTSTMLTVDGTTSTLAALATLSAKSRVIIVPATGSPTVAGSISAVGPHVEGQVVSVVAASNTLTVQGPNGSANQVITVGTTATISLDGSASTLSSIVAGDLVDIRLSATDGTTAIAVNAQSQSSPGNGGDNGGGDNGGGENGGNPSAPISSAAFGTISSVDTSANTVTLSVLTPAGTTAQQTYSVTNSTTITVDGNTATLASLSGLSSMSRVILQTTSGSATTAASISAVGPHVEGAVVSVNTSTITLQGPNGGTNQTYTVGSGAVITLDGSASTLSAIVAGDDAQLRLSATDGTTVISLQADAQSGNPTGGGTSGNGGNSGGNNNNGGGGNPAGNPTTPPGLALGIVSSVNTGNNTITVSALSDAGTTQSQTFSVTGTTAITVDGSTSTLAALSNLTAGSHVVVQTSSSSATTATAITILGPEVDGRLGSVSATSISLSGPNGIAYTLANNVTININNSVGTLSGLSTAENVQLKLSALNGTVLQLNAESNSGGGSGPGGSSGPNGNGPGPGTGSGMNPNGPAGQN